MTRAPASMRIYVSRRAPLHSPAALCCVAALYCMKALSDLVDREQSGAAAAAESTLRDMEMKAKEESDLVQECQVRHLLSSFDVVVIDRKTCLPFTRIRIIKVHSWMFYLRSATI